MKELKSYIKPVFDYVELTVEERFAVGSTTCTVSGTCPGGGFTDPATGIFYKANLEL